MEELHLIRVGDEENYRIPHAPYVLRPIEKMEILRMIKAVQTPSGHCASFAKLVDVEKGKLQYMNNHDWHVLLEEVLPAALRGSMPEGPRIAVIRLGHCFKRICEKAIRVSDLPALQTYVAETCALLKVHFSSAFRM